MARRYRKRQKLTLWCWRCGVEFEATRTDCRTCGAACRQAVNRDFRNGVFEAFIFPFRWGPRRGRASPVYNPENVAAINARRGPKWL